MSIERVNQSTRKVQYYTTIFLISDSNPLNVFGSLRLLLFIGTVVNTWPRFFLPCQQEQVLQNDCCDLNVSDTKSQIVNMGK